MKYEYKIISAESSIDTLNEYGENGWEIIGTTPKGAYIAKRLKLLRDVVLIEDVLHDIEIGRTKASGRIKALLRHAKLYEDKCYLNEVSLPTRNYGEKTGREWAKLNELYLMAQPSL